MNRILVIRLGAMGDVLHALPAVAALRAGHRSAHLAWIVDPRWRPLLEGNPGLDEIIAFDRRAWSSIRSVWRRLHETPFDVAVDFQGLLKSGVLALASGAAERWGLERAWLREGAAALAYTHRIDPRGAHVVERNLELAWACGGCGDGSAVFVPAGRAEGNLPERRFVLACPLAGWPAKQWPLERYGALATLLKNELDTDLALNGAPAAETQLRAVPGVAVHTSGIEGLIDATRRASAVLGLDSGPLHLAAALGKRGVALYGPTDPARNGPWGGTIRILRAAGAATSYTRRMEVSASMRALEVQQVFEALRDALA